MLKTPFARPLPPWSRPRRGPARGRRRPRAGRQYLVVMHGIWSWPVNSTQSCERCGKRLLTFYGHFLEPVAARFPGACIESAGRRRGTA